MVKEIINELFTSDFYKLSEGRTLHKLSHNLFYYNNQDVYYILMTLTQLKDFLRDDPKEILKIFESEEELEDYLIRNYISTIPED